MARIFEYSTTLHSPAETAHLAVRLAETLTAGDVILLEGSIGAGKTHFARALIQSRLDVPEDVPSPTFTLVQIYDTADGEIWHSDLYRLGHPDEVVELGLLDAFEDAICLIEWPDRLGDLIPKQALTITLAEAEEDIDARSVRLSWTDSRWTDRVSGVFND